MYGHLNVKNSNATHKNWWQNQYDYLLWTRLSGVKTLVESRDLVSIPTQNKKGNHPAFSTMGTRALSTEGEEAKWWGHGVNHPRHRAPHLRMSTAIPLQPLCFFMACYGATFFLQKQSLNVQILFLIWGLFDRASSSWNNLKCQPDATRQLY